MMKRIFVFSICVPIFLVLVVSLVFGQVGGGSDKARHQTVLDKSPSWIKSHQVSNAKKHYVSVLVKTAAMGQRGTGVIIRTGLVLTNYHLVTHLKDDIEEDEEETTPKVYPCGEDIELTAEYVDGQMELDEEDKPVPITERYIIMVNNRQAKILAKDVDMDLLLLAVSTPAVSTLRISNSVATEEPVFSVGDPVGKPSGHISSGSVLAAGQHGILSTIFAKPGYSGSGLYSVIDGNLVGINTLYNGSKTAKDEKCRYGFARNGRDIKTFLLKAGVILK